MYKKLFIFLFISSLFLAGNVSAYESWKINENIVNPEKRDRRILLLEAYLKKYNSPLNKEAKHFVEAADKYNLDWKLVAAISGVESTFGKFTPGNTQYPSYNGWGWGVYGNQARCFKSWKDGIYTVSEGLRLNYFNKGLTNPYTINKVYAASPTWGAHVSYFLADMEKFENDYQDNQNLQSLADKDKISEISAIPKI